MIKMTGSVISTRSGQRSCRLGNILRTGVLHDIYASYSEKNHAEVWPVLDMLKHNQLTVYNPYMDGMPNETVFKAWLERGIYKAKVSLIFLTKSFVQSAVCRFQSESSAMHYVKTKGQHRVLLVMLESCRVPKNLRHFHCVFAWKHREDPVKQYTRILKAIFAPKTKFRRGSLVWTSANTSLIANRKCFEFPSYQPRKADLKKWTLLFNLPNIKFALGNCQLTCSSDNCTFRCDGVHILDMFLPHIKECKYQQVRCSFCRQRILRKNLQKHEEKACRSKPVVCPNECCGKKMPAKLLKGHSLVCLYREETCPNEKDGCNHVFAIKDKAKHLEICDYERQMCYRCHNPYFRLDIDNHDCKVSFSSTESYTDTFPAVYNCRSVHCGFSGTKQEVEAHLFKCIYKIEQCSDCGVRLPVAELVWHKKQCDKLVVCELCHQRVPSSSKVTHDRWSCRGQSMRSMCMQCRKWISYGTLEDHQTTCNAQVIVENIEGITGVTGGSVPSVTHARDFHVENGIPIQQPPLVLWTTDRRNRWRELMYTIDHNFSPQDDVAPLSMHGTQTLGDNCLCICDKRI